MKLIRAFVFTSQIVPSLFYLNPKFQASSLLAMCDSTGLFVSDLVGSPNCWFSHAKAHFIVILPFIPSCAYFFPFYAGVFNTGHFFLHYFVSSNFDYFYTNYIYLNIYNIIML